MVTFHGTVTYYQLESAFDPSFSSGTNRVQFAATSSTQVTVGTPTWDGATFYYHIAACNDQGCSTWSPLLALGRRIWPTAQDWNMVAGGYSHGSTVYLWAQNASPVAGKASDLYLYDGIQGYGGTVVYRCLSVSPGGVCQTSYSSGSSFVSASQAFPPYGEVGIAFRVR